MAFSEVDQEFLCDNDPPTPSNSTEDQASESSLDGRFAENTSGDAGAETASTKSEASSALSVPRLAVAPYLPQLYGSVIEKNTFLDVMDGVCYTESCRLRAYSDWTGARKLKSDIESGFRKVLPSELLRPLKNSGRPSRVPGVSCIDSPRIASRPSLLPWGAEPTTLTITNLPLEVETEEMVEVLDRQEFSGLYDFVVVHDGTATLNVVQHRYGLKLALILRGQRVIAGQNSPAACEVQWSFQLQGLEQVISHFRNHPSNQKDVPDDQRPQLFSHGWPIAFPAPIGQ